jgi:hypothetical protein
MHERFGPPLVVTDDDVSGTFTFPRALPDYGNSLDDLTPARIGQTWLNYVIEGRSTFWWGGLGLSAEHTAYLRLKTGIPAPRSGSAAVNGKALSEQIGAQIFIDGWAIVSPGGMWKRAWVQAVDRFDSSADEPYRLIQDSGRGLLIQGAREWGDYEVGASVRPHMVKAAGMASDGMAVRPVRAAG